VRNRTRIPLTNCKILRGSYTAAYRPTCTARPRHRVRTARARPLRFRNARRVEAIHHAHRGACDDDGVQGQDGHRRGTTNLRQRSQIAEFPHAWIKERCGLRQFRCRNRLKVAMEATGRASATTDQVVQHTAQVQSSNCVRLGRSTPRF